MSKMYAPVSFSVYEALRIKKQADLVILCSFGCSQSASDLAIVQFSNIHKTTRWHRLTRFIMDNSFALKDDGDYLYFTKAYGGGITTLHTLTCSAEPLEAVMIPTSAIPAEATEVNETTW